MQSLIDTEKEIARQIELWGVQSHPFGTNSKWLELAELAKQKTDAKASDGTLTWKDILLEELLEALGEEAIPTLREELIQTAAVCLSWVNDIDSINLPAILEQV
jgi:hypothetical protein